MIKSFADKESEKLYITGKATKLPSAIIKTALRKLDYLNSALYINDLRVPPGNRLELLKGKYKGKYSIRINNQFRIVSSFYKSNVYDVDIIDYHK